MLLTVFLALFLPCVGMSVVFLVYICLVWYAATYHHSSTHQNQPVKPTKENGLSAEQLDKLPKITGKEMVLSNDCAVCLENIESEQQVRLVPGCNHGFHLECADMWLSKHPFCPVCRSKLELELFNTSPECNSCWKKNYYLFCNLFQVFGQRLEMLCVVFLFFCFLVLLC